MKHFIRVSLFFAIITLVALSFTSCDYITTTHTITKTTLYTWSTSDGRTYDSMVNVQASDYRVGDTIEVSYYQRYRHGEWVHSSHTNVSRQRRRLIKPE